MNRIAAALAALALSLGGCSAPAVPTSPSPAQVTSTTPASPTPTTASPIPTPELGLVLSGDGLGGLKFGTLQAQVEEVLAEQLGQPDEEFLGIVCELDDASPWAQTSLYGGLSVRYNAKDQSSKSARRLNWWGFRLIEDFRAPLRMVDDVPLDLNLDQLKKRYPDGKLEDIGFGDGAWIFTLPNKIRFLGIGNEPEQVEAGELSFCE